MTNFNVLQCTCVMQLKVICGTVQLEVVTDVSREHVYNNVYKI